MRPTKFAIAMTIPAALSACAVEPDEETASSDIAAGAATETVQGPLTTGLDSSDGFGTHRTVRLKTLPPHGDWSVVLFWGFDYNPDTNHLRGWARMMGNSSNSSNIHLQAEPLNLGDRNRVLKSLNANAQHGFLELETDAVDCHRPNGVYLSNLHYSIRWPDGVLTAGQQSGQYEESARVICR